MTESNTGGPSAASSWDAYWQGTGETGAYSSGGANHPAILAFWNDFFSSIKETYPRPSLLDIASGNGAVIERALDSFTAESVELTCVDISSAAIENIQGRFGSVRGITADACSIPLEADTFDIVTSQFGLEYAGSDAFQEAWRLLAPGGQLGFLIHHAGGRICQECKVNLEAVERFQSSGFVAKSTNMFRAGFDAVRGADRQPYDDAARDLAPAVAEAETIMKQLGENVADDTIARIYSDVGRIHSEMMHYDPEEVLNWMTRMDQELTAYTGRMSTMVASAMDQPEFDAVCTSLSDQGCEVSQAGPLLITDYEAPLAWVLLAHKSP